MLNTWLCVHYNFGIINIIIIIIIIIIYTLGVKDPEGFGKNEH